MKGSSEEYEEWANYAIDHNSPHSGQALATLALAAATAEQTDHLAMIIEHSAKRT